MNSYQRSLVIRFWYQGFSVAKMANHPCLMALESIVRTEIEALMDCGAIGRTGVK